MFHVEGYHVVAHGYYMVTAGVRLHIEMLTGRAILQSLAGFSNMAIVQSVTYTLTLPHCMKSQIASGIF